jgi:hypothetical protein
MVSLAGEAGGVALDLTGVGALAGAPVGALATAGVATGAGMIGAAVAHINSTSDGAAAGGKDGPDPPTKITGRTAHGEIRAQGRDGHGVNDAAMEDAVEHPTKPPKFNPDDKGGRWEYVGKDATVVLNKDGEVVTAWARNRAGWRHP